MITNSVISECGIIAYVVVVVVVVVSFDPSYKEEIVTTITTRSQLQVVQCQSRYCAYLHVQPNMC